MIYFKYFIVVAFFWSSESFEKITTQNNLPLQNFNHYFM